MADQMTMNESHSCYSWTSPLTMLLFQTDWNKPHFVRRVV